MTITLDGLGPDQKRELLARLLRERGPRDVAQHPLTPGQQALWFLARLMPESTAHHVAFAARVRSPIDAAALERALASLTARHEALRTRFRDREGVPVQEVVADITLPLERMEVRDLADEAVHRQVQAAYARPFDLERPPLFRLSLYSRSENDHVLLLTVHHIVADYWSVVVLITELLELYAAAHEGRPPNLPAPPPPFVEHVHLSNAMLAGAAGQQLWAYWRDALADIPAPSPLAWERPNTATSSVGTTHRFDVPPSVAVPLRTLARAEGVTPFVIFIAAVHVLVSRHTGGDDIVVGSLAAGRTRARFRNTVGHFVNPVAIRVRLDEDLTGRELLARTREAALGALRNQEFPYPLVVERLNPERRSREARLFRAMLVLQNLPITADVASLIVGRPGTRARAGGLDLEAFPIAQQEGEWEITIEVTEVTDGFACELKYGPDVFSADDAARFGRHYVRLLAALVETPGRRVSELEVLDAEERQQQLVEWNQTAAPLPADRRVTDWLDEQARTRPGAVAVSERGRSLTYVELRDRVERVAGRMATIGVLPETLVAVYAERGIDLLTALLAAQRAGGAFLALDPRHPLDRNRRLIESSGARLLVVAPDARQAVALRTSACVPCITDFADLVGDNSGVAWTPPAVDLRALAYVVFTSGSTGAPKGAMIDVGGLVNHLMAKVEDLRLGPGDVIAQTASMSFDISIWQSFVAIVAGGTTAIVDDESSLLPGLLIDEIERCGITVLELVPSILRLLVSEAATNARARQVLGQLRVLLSTGEPLSAGLCRQWFQVRPDVPLVNAYGPTECADDVTHHIIESPPPETAVRMPIGRPIRNTRLYVLGAAGALIPAGAPGELYVGGAGVGRGYLFDAGRTQRAFVPDPFAGPGARLYRTGDRVRWLPDGSLDLIGRMDDQVKVRGHRVEPGEIESVLESHPAVRAAAVAPRPDARGETALAAYLVPRDRQPSADELRAFLRERLPEGMVPHRFVYLDRLPTTSNGKIDRATLPTPEDTPATAYVGPRSPLEEAIAGIWADVLARDRISIHDDFFDLGGHSLAVTQIAFRIRERFHVEVPLVQLFERPTIAELARAVQELQQQPVAPRQAQLGAPESTPTLGRLILFEERPLAEQILGGELPPVESAALSYLPDALLSIPGLDRNRVIDDFCGGGPYIGAVLDTPLGRIASIVLPRFASECYGDPQGLAVDCERGWVLARDVGARVVSLGGILASATDYGRNLNAIQGDGPRFTTGHATTAAAVVLALTGLLRGTSRHLSHERVAFVGLGSVGVASLRLMLRRMPHPEALLLCEVYRRRDALEALRTEVREQFGFAGELLCLPSHQAVATGAYDASVIVGATNVPDVLDVARLAPGTILVDDSAPHCFPLAAAARRLEERADILFTEGGTLHLPQPFESRQYFPAAAERALGVSRLQVRHTLDPQEITGCVLSSLLSVRRPDLAPVLGVPEVTACEAHLDTLVELGCSPSPFRGRGNMLGEVYVPSADAVARFRDRFGTRVVSGGSERATR